MKADVQWHGGLTFNGTADSGFTLPLGGSPTAGGNNDGFRPMELILLGLAGCTGMDVVSILRKMRQNVTDFQVHLESKRSDQHPKVFTYIRVHYVIHGHNLKANSVERAIELFSEKFLYFVKNIDRMDVLFGSSFSKLEDVGKPFTRCGHTR